MQNQSNEFGVLTGPRPAFLAGQGRGDRATLYGEDIRRPWRSVHGFPMTAARLALGQGLRLHCREDEVFGLLERLNGLLESPDSLSRAYHLLREREKAMGRKLVRLMALRQELPAHSETPGLLEGLEQALAEPATQTVAGRLEELLSPNHPIQEIAGALKMLERLRPLDAALRKVKDKGFHVVIQAGCRQPARPALEARRQAPILLNGRPTAIPAGFLLPAACHPSLWTYLVVRGEGGQSTLWN